MKKDNKAITLNEMANTGNKWVIVTNDETEYWGDDLKEFANKIEAVYLINLHEPTHLCELAVSFPAIHLKNFVPDAYDLVDLNDDRLAEIETHFDTEVRYFKGNSTFIPQKYYEEEFTEDEVIDMENANPTIC